jgi:hypothetical protein
LNADAVRLHGSKPEIVQQLRPEDRTSIDPCSLRIPPVLLNKALPDPVEAAADLVHLGLWSFGTFGTIGTRSRAGRRELSPHRQSLCKPDAHAASADTNSLGLTS